MFNVRGMGVADNVSTSTCRAISLSFSLWVTPKRCSSSTTSSPRSLKWMSFCSSLWVPMSRSICPAARSDRICRACPGVWKRLSTRISTGKERKRFTAVAKCCCARTVVGTRMAACLPSSTHFITARRATSVLP